MKKITFLILLISQVALAQNSYTYESYDILTGNYPSTPQHLTYFNGKVYFSANFSVPGVNIEVGYCNVATGALGQLPEINTVNASAGSFPNYFFEFNDYLYFTAYSQPNLENCELYRTNGTVIELVKDLIPGIGSGFPQGTNPRFTIMNNKLYFFARNNPLTGDLVLYQTDGLAENTIVVSEIILSSNYDTPIIVFNNELYYCGSQNLGQELYKFNDVTNTVSLLKDMYPGSIGSSPGYLTIFNNQLFFSAFTPAYGGKRHICKTDGTPAGTTEVLDATNFSFNPCGLKVIDNKLIYVAVNPNFNNAIDLFKCELNGANYQIGLVKHFTQGGSVNPLYLTTELTAFNNNLYFVSSILTDPYNGFVRQIYKTDGTTEGSVKAITINSDQIGALTGATPTSLFAFNGKLCFSMVDDTNQQQLWISDGSNTYFEKLTNLGGPIPQSVNQLNDHAIFENKLYFSGGSANQFLNGELFSITDSSALGINELRTSVKPLLFPNPTAGILNLKGENISVFQIEIYDLLGKKVAQFKNQESIDISNLFAGMYIVKITDLQTNTSQIQKVIKQ